MAQIESEVLEAIRTAIQLEKDGRAFFEDAAESTDNEQGKKVFRALAQDEIGHLRVFAAIADAVTEGKDWHDVVPAGEPVKRAQIFIKDDTPKSPTGGSDTETAVLEKAVRLEKEAIEFFRDAASKAQDPTAKSLFDRIRQEEEHHYDLLQAELDAVTNSGFWFDIQEFKLDGLY